MYGDDRLASCDYAKIINRRHFERSDRYLDNGEVAIGGRYDEEGCRIEPTVLVGVEPDSEIMREEIFGPILPIMRSTPGFSHCLRSPARQAAGGLPVHPFPHQRTAFVESVSTGNVCINDVLMFMSVPELPFGGVGMSGMGQYHGKAGFDRFSHLKAVMKRSRFPEIPIRFPPYTDFKLRLLKRLG
jgi:aldehyde dehydrogenase (NAD+)